jgi:hypothetical protein
MVMAINFIRIVNFTRVGGSMVFKIVRVVTFGKIVMNMYDHGEDGLCVVKSF